MIVCVSGRVLNPIVENHVFTVLRLLDLSIYRSIENNRSAYRDRLSLRGISERIGTRGNNVHTHKGVSLKIITFCQN